MAGDKRPPFLTHVDLCPNLQKVKNTPCLQRHCWNRCGGLISCPQGLPGSGPYCQGAMATSTLGNGAVLTL